MDSLVVDSRVVEHGLGWDTWSKDNQLVDVRQIVKARSKLTSNVQAGSSKESSLLDTGSLMKMKE